MALKVKYYIRATEKTKIAKIYVRFINGSKFDYKTKSDYQVEPRFWNSKKNELRRMAEFKHFDKLQSNLKKLESFIFESYEDESNKDEVNLEWFKTTVDKHFNPGKYSVEENKSKTLFEFITHFIENSHKRLNEKTGKPVTYKMKREYNASFNWLKLYAKKYGEPDFIDIDLEFYENFVAFLRSNDLATNTIGKKIQTLKIFLNDAKEKGMNPYIKYQSRKFKTLTEESDNIYLNEDELKQFYVFDFSNNERLEKVRDTFILGCWIGQRYSDWGNVTEKNIKGNFIELEQSKTKKKVVIPLHKTVKEILLKYEGEIPELISNQKFNNFIKEAAKIARIDGLHEKKINKNGMEVKKHVPKYELIGTHTARRSFCTNNYKKGIPTISIMAVSGHTTEKSFLKYIKAKPEEHAAKMLEFWNREQIQVAK